MSKVVISERHGGFGLSTEAEVRMRELGWDGKDERDIERDDPRLVQVVEEMGDAANSRYSNLKVIEIPDDVKWHVHEYDGFESLHEDHRSWGSDAR